MSGFGTGNGCSSGVRNPRSPDQHVGMNDVIGILGVSIDASLFVLGQDEGPGESGQLRY